MLPSPSRACLVATNGNKVVEYDRPHGLHETQELFLISHIFAMSKDVSRITIPLAALSGILLDGEYLSFGNELFELLRTAYDERRHIFAEGELLHSQQYVFKLNFGRVNRLYSVSRHIRLF